MTKCGGLAKYSGRTYRRNRTSEEIAAALQYRRNPYGEDKVSAACSIFGMMSRRGRLMNGKDVVIAITNMHDRSNGLGGGFAVYGCYPEFRNHYAFHVMYEDTNVKSEVEEVLAERFYIDEAHRIPTHKTPGLTDTPVFWRYFARVKKAEIEDIDEADMVVGQVMRINTGFPEAFIISGGRNMGVFKGVGFPEQIAEFFGLEDYQGYLWTGHGRFPTNTPGWWGGAHPFSLLDWTVVHNGEISSYGINRRHLEMYGYHCTMQTDTEVMAYAVDLLLRRHKLPVELMAKILAPPFWSQIKEMPAKEAAQYATARQIYSSLLMNGPFTVIIAHRGEMIGLTDRIRLRPLTVGRKDDMVYLSSEEAAIRLVCPNLEKAWIPKGGEPQVARLTAAARKKFGLPALETPAKPGAGGRTKKGATAAIAC